VDDRIGPGGEHGLPHGVSVEDVEHHRLRAQGAQTVCLPGGARAADHLVTPLDELRDEPRAEGARRPCDEDSHVSLLSLSTRGTRRRFLL
jgi:hypothetical protein